MLYFSSLWFSSNFGYFPLLSDEFHTHLACEGHDLVLVCPKKTTRIAIYSAQFGRTAAGQKECPTENQIIAGMAATCTATALDGLSRDLGQND